MPNTRVRGRRVRTINAVRVPYSGSVEAHLAGEASWLRMYHSLSMQVFYGSYDSMANSTYLMGDPPCFYQRDGAELPSYIISLGVVDVPVMNNVATMASLLSALSQNLGMRLPLTLRTNISGGAMPELSPTIGCDFFPLLCRRGILIATWPMRWRDVRASGDWLNRLCGGENNLSVLSSSIDLLVPRLTVHRCSAPPFVLDPFLHTLPLSDFMSREPRDLPSALMPPRSAVDELRRRVVPTPVVPLQSAEESLRSDTVDWNHYHRDRIVTDDGDAPAVQVWSRTALEAQNMREELEPLWPWDSLPSGRPQEGDA